MKIIVLSDTHGNYPQALRALEMAGEADQIIHLGDGIDDVILLEQLCGRNIIRVAGNCDFATSEPAEAILTFSSRVFLITHGNQYNVKGGLEHLLVRAHAVNAQVVLFGHTHQPLLKETEGILFVNPGSLKQGDQENTFAIINLFNDTLKVSHISVKQAQ